MNITITPRGVKVQKGDELICSTDERVGMLLDKTGDLKRFYNLTQNECFLVKNCPLINYAQITENTNILQHIINMLHKKNKTYLHCKQILNIIYTLNGTPPQYTCIECNYYIPNAGNQSEKT